MKLKIVITALLLSLTSPAFALNILLSNDDGLTSNLKALYDALKAEGHDVIVSVPCSGQSGRGAAIVMYSTTVITADNDKTQIDAEGGCHNGAAAVGAPAVGLFTKTGYTNGDFNYVHGTPVMATLYGLDVLSLTRWGKNPDLVLSGPNEGQNVGKIVNSSGTIGNAQVALARGIPAIALSAGTNTIDNTNLANPNSVVVAQLSVKLLKELQAKAGSKRGLLPKGVSLNVNFPNTITVNTPWAFSRIGSFDLYNLKFKSTAPYGLSFSINNPASATTEQAEDESVIFSNKIAVTAMQASFEQRIGVQTWLRNYLGALFQ